MTETTNRARTSLLKRFKNRILFPFNEGDDAKGWKQIQAERRAMNEKHAQIYRRPLIRLQEIDRRQSEKSKTRSDI